MRDWRRYIGLPHVFGADPENGEGADCLVMVFGVLDAMGVSHPRLNQQWLELAAAGDWPQLQRLWAAGTRPLPAPEDGAVTLIQNGAGGLGVAVVVDGGLLMVHHRRGVIWTPLEALKPLSYCAFA